MLIKRVPYLSAGFKVCPCLAPEYAEASMKIDESLGTVSTRLKAAPFVTNNISKVPQTIDRVMPFGKFGDVSSSSRYIATDKILN